MSYLIKYIDGNEEKKVIKTQSELRYLIEVLKIIGYKRIK